MGLKMLTLLLLALASTPAITAFECGVANPAARVFGGQAQTYLKYPWYASLHLTETMQPSSTDKVDQSTLLLCGGSLISPSFVMTAAHCYKDIEQYFPGVDFKDYFYVTLGIFSKCQDTSSAATYKTTDVFIHPEYKHALSLQDVAILKLDGSSDLMPVCLPPQGAPIEHVDVANVAGFGLLAQDDKEQPCEMNEAVVEIYTNKECSDKSQLLGLIRMYLLDHDRAFCAGHMDGGPDACQGDSGSSLLVEKDGKYVAVGISTFGDGCGDQGKPGVYMNVAFYIDWIKEKVGGELERKSACKKNKKMLKKRKGRVG